MSIYTYICASPRIHLGLIDCGNATARQYGGSGLSIKGLFTKVRATTSTEWRVEFAKKTDVSARTVQDVTALVNRLKEVCPPTHVTVISGAPEHKGLGSKTTLLLCVTTASFAAHNKHISREEIVMLTQRGGASGAGVNLFWDGGFVIDAGHATPQDDRSFAPSSEARPFTMPPANVRAALPTEWRVALFFDAAGKTIEGKHEKEIFAKSMPLPEIESLRALAVTYHELLPSVLNANLIDLSKALHNINTVGMKAIEVSCQSKQTIDFLRELWSNNIAAGLSSFGPCVFVIADKDSVFDHVGKLASTHNLTRLGVFPFNNYGTSLDRRESQA